MSKTVNDAITIVDYVAPAAPNKYDAHVDALIQAGEGKAVAITVPRGANKEGAPLEGKDAGRPDRVAFQKAAGARGFTARVRSLTESGDDVTITFTLQPKIERKTAESDSVDDVAVTE